VGIVLPPLKLCMAASQDQSWPGGHIGSEFDLDFSAGTE
jgi:hypothetical protein